MPEGRYCSGVANDIASALDGPGLDRDAAERLIPSKGAKKPATDKTIDSVKLLRARFRLGSPDDSDWRTMRPLD
jgi:hypothetical protein